MSIHTITAVIGNKDKIGKRLEVDVECTFERGTPEIPRSWAGPGEPAYGDELELVTVKVNGFDIIDDLSESTIESIMSQVHRELRDDGPDPDLYRDAWNERNG